MAFAEFTAAVVKRYSGSFVPEPDAPSPQGDSLDQQLVEGPLGSLVGTGEVLPPPPPPAKELGPLPKVSWWTIWNEPNHPGFLQPQYIRAPDGRLEPNTPHLAWKNPQVRTWPQFLLRDLGVVNADKAARGARPHADWQSGLLFEDGTPKPAATSFKLALFVDCVTPAARTARRKGRRPANPRRSGARSLSPKRRLVIWGHVRPGAAAQHVVLEESRSGSPAWRKSRTAGIARARRSAAYSRRAVVTSTSGVFVRHAPWRRGVRYRLRIPGPPGTAESGLPVRPVPCGRKAERVARDDGEY